MERRVERALRRLLAIDGREPSADLLERERIVADEVAVLVTNVRADSAVSA